MQTERVTFLTTPDHKAALDTYAASSGKSVGHVLREASVRYIAQEQDQEAQLAALVQEVNRAVPKMQASIDDMIATVRGTRERVEASLRAAGFSG